MDTAISRDGTPIAYQCSGRGPVLVLVVGAFCDRTSTADLAPLLAPSFTVVEYDRRGRGSSGAGREPCAVEREVEDLGALVAAVGEPAALYGHSSGGALALEAAAAGVPVTRLAVYEPPYTAGPDGGGSGELLSAVRARIGAGDPDGAAEVFLGATGMPAAALAGLRGSPAWPRMRALAPGLVADLGLTRGGVVPADRFARIGAPTLAVSGGASDGWAARACAAVAAAVPGARHEVLPGQGHGVDAAAVAPLLLDWFGVIG